MTSWTRAARDPETGVTAHVSISFPEGQSPRVALLLLSRLLLEAIVWTHDRSES